MLLKLTKLCDNMVSRDAGLKKEFCDFWDTTLEGGVASRVLFD